MVVNSFEILCFHLELISFIYGSIKYHVETGNMISIPNNKEAKFLLFFCFMFFLSR